LQSAGVRPTAAAAAASGGGIALSVAGRGVSLFEQLIRV